MRFQSVSSLFVIALLGMCINGTFHASALNSRLEQALGASIPHPPPPQAPHYPNDKEKDDKKYHHEDKDDNVINGKLGTPLILTSPNVSFPVFNPYGMVVFPEDVDHSKKGDLFISGWNDACGNFGQGNNVAVIRGKKVIRSFDVDHHHDRVPPQCLASGNLGLTMAMTYLAKGKMLQCSVPIAVNGALPNNKQFPKNGCCLIINDQGDVLFSFHDDKLLLGPWGAFAVKEDDKIYIFISNVLGGGDKAKWNKGFGFVTRYILTGDFDSHDWSHVHLSAPQVVATNFTSFPAVINGTPGIQGGAVGPSGVSVLKDTLYISGTEDGPNNFGDIVIVKNALHCNGGTSPDKTGDCHQSVLVTCNKPNSGQCSNPVGLNFVTVPEDEDQKEHGHDDKHDDKKHDEKKKKDGHDEDEDDEKKVKHFIVPNGADGFIVEYDPKGHQVANKHINQTINNAKDPAAGFLFNAIQEDDEVWFVDDNFNSATPIFPPKDKGHH